MDVLAPPPVASAPTTSTVGTPPRLGTPVPGTTGGLPALGGLSVNASPMAQQLQSAGRGQDTMLVHMTPGEVNSLQGLAMAHGGSLTINPQTGLPEAGFLSRILPTLLGAGLTFIPGIGPLAAAGIVGLGTGAVTGDIGKGLMAGLGAFGGASLAGALAPTATGTSLAAEAGSKVAEEAAKKAAEQAITKPLGEAATTAVQQGTNTMLGQLPANLQGFPELVQEAATTTAKNIGAIGPGQAINLTSSGLGATSAAATGAATTTPSTNILTNFGRAARNALPQGTPGIVSRAAPMLAGYGMVAPLMQPYSGEFPEQEEEDYTIPQYRRRSVYPRIPEGPAYARTNYPGEIQFFDPAGFQRMAEGDEVPAPRDETAPAPGGLASLGASLPEYVKMFQTSPGAITGVPYGYGPGQSPTELIRAQIAANAAAAPPAAIAPAASPIAAAPSFGAETDYGLMKNAPKSNPMSLYGDDYGYVGDYGYPASGFDYLRGYAHGGAVEMESGGFVMPARETAEFGNGSTEAGQRRLAAMGGMPIRGRGDGTSDSIRARIDGTQQARLADGETYFPPRAVERMGGADKLRAMMNKATKSRQQAARGGDNKLRGLA